MPVISARAASFTESVIREMTRLAVERRRRQPGPGLPRLRVPARAQGRRRRGASTPTSTSTRSPGAPSRSATRSPPRRTRFHPDWVDRPRDPAHRHLRRDRGDDRGDARRCSTRATRSSSSSRSTRTTAPTRSCPGAIPRYVTLHEPDWSIDPDELRAAFGPRTRAIVLNSPHNPTGKVFTRAELELIADAVQSSSTSSPSPTTSTSTSSTRASTSRWPRCPGMAERTVAINSMSKTYSVTGWRVGWVIAPAELTVGIRKVHDFLTVGAAAPLQAAAAVALRLPGRLLRDARRRLPGAARPARCRRSRRPGSASTCRPARTT